MKTNKFLTVLNRSLTFSNFYRSLLRPYLFTFTNMINSILEFDTLPTLSLIDRNIMLNRISEKDLQYIIRLYSYLQVEVENYNQQLPNFITELKLYKQLDVKRFSDMYIRGLNNRIDKILEALNLN